MSPAATKEHAHELIDRIPPVQLSAVVDLLEDLLDPLAIKLANAAIDDEPTTAEDRAALARSRVADIVSTEDLLASVGLTLEHFHKMAQSPS